MGIDVKFSVDELSGVMMLVVTGVGFLIHLYSTSYMAKDRAYHRFFAYLNLFVFSMLVLILADNMPLLFVGWEGVGACSYLLIGFWYEKTPNAEAGRKAFIANRIGDVGMIGGMFLLAHYTGALDWTGISEHVMNMVVKPGAGPNMSIVPERVILVENAATAFKWGGYAFLGLGAILALSAFMSEGRGLRIGLGVGAVILLAIGGLLEMRVGNAPPMVTMSPATLCCLALFLGCTGKSAQIPLYVWLPDAMAGPTPVSALIHAATMVTSGLYLVCRLNFLFVCSPVAMAVMACVGAATALFAATIGLVQNDIKKVLAYSTVSQLGFMFLGVGVGAFAMGFFHVVTHAFFKACLFLGAGSVIHAMHARIHDDVVSQDMRKMGGLRKYMPWTYLSMGAATLAISGLPLTSGFFSKDGILYHAWVNRVVNPMAATAEFMLQNEKLDAQTKAAAQNMDAMFWHAPSWLGPVLFCVGIVAATCTAFYMFRLLFMTFWGEFRGWKVADDAALRTNPMENEEPLVDDAPDAHDAHGDHDAHGVLAAHAEEHHDDAHEHHDEEHHDDHDEPGEAPAEAPWPMAIPVAILGGLALVAGFLYAEPLHLEPLGHFWEPVFASVMQHVDKADTVAGYVLLKEGAEKLEWPLMLPGVLAFLGGSYVAFLWYVRGGGETPARIAGDWPTLHRAALNKWYVDEIYDATIVGGTDALADGAALIDTWIIDGIIAKLTAFVARMFGGLFRIFQNGVVHVYAGILAIGTLGLVLFFWQPHPDVSWHREGDTFTVEAAPGLGYEYKWTTAQAADSAFVTGDDAMKRKVTVPLGQSTSVSLEVKNAFGRTSMRTITLVNPAPSSSASSSASAMPSGSAPPLPKGIPPRPTAVPSAFQ
jgi:NADH-quinone oxidoreductase subunit L